MGERASGDNDCRGSSTAVIIPDNRESRGSGHYRGGMEIAGKEGEEEEENQGKSERRGRMENICGESSGSGVLWSSKRECGGKNERQIGSGVAGDTLICPFLPPFYLYKVSPISFLDFRRLRASAVHAPDRTIIPAPLAKLKHAVRTSRS